MGQCRTKKDVPESGNTEEGTLGSPTSQEETPCGLRGPGRVEALDGEGGTPVPRSPQTCRRGSDDWGSKDVCGLNTYFNPLPVGLTL